MKHKLVLLSFIASILISGCSTTTEESQPGSSLSKSEPVTTSKDYEAFPRTRESSLGKFVFHEPQIVEWIDFQEMIAWVAVEIHPKSGGEPVIGSMKISAQTRNYLGDRLVNVHDKKVLEIKFPEDAIFSESQIREALVTTHTKEKEMLPLDVVLAYVSDSVPVPEHVAYKMDPPSIFVSKTPAILINIDGKPLYAPIEGTDLEYILNTNWDIFRIKEKETLYLRNENQWLTANNLKSDWAITTGLPNDFSRIPNDDNWIEVKASMDEFSVQSQSSLPRVFVSQTPAELIVIQGDPNKIKVGDGDLNMISNTSSDLFYNSSQNKYYYLVSGRWFSASSLNGANWSHAPELPEEFKKIPEDHPAATVRANVPGTKEAHVAVLEAQIPQIAVVDRDSTTVEVFYTGEPEFKPAGAPGVEYAANTSFIVMKVEDRYYVCHNAVWFESDDAEGPWVVASKVPDSVYTIPPESPVYNVTQVKVYDYSPVSVTFGYTYGYYGCYPYYGSVIWGTGWYYDPWSYYPSYGYPYYYYPYPYTYGCGAWYNPGTGMYGRAGFAYGPYGGIGRGAAFNPETGTFARGRAAWGPYGGVGSGWAYSPRTGIGGATRRGYDAYSSWGETVLRRDDNWLHTKSYRDSRGGAIGYETSRGGQGAIIGNGDNRAVIGRGGDNGNKFVGKDGSVYRKDENGWAKHDNGDWSPLTAPSDLKNKVSEIDRDQLSSQLQKSRDQFNARQTERDFSSIRQDGSQRSARNSSWSGANIPATYQLERDWNARSRGNSQFQNYQRSGGNNFNRGGSSFGGRSFRGR